MHRFRSRVPVCQQRSAVRATGRSSERHQEMTMSDATTDSLRRRRANGWPVLPMRIFLAAVFLFAGYAKLAYPHFLDPNSTTGFRASVASAKSGTPIGGLLGPLTDHPSLFGHLTAYAEIAIGLGL